MKVVALHGFLGRGSDFAPLFSALEKRTSFEKWTPDLFAPLRVTATGSSPWLRGEGFEDWSEQFLDLIPPGYRTLIGYSFGGRLALHLALKAPEKWDNVFLISANPGVMNDSDRRQRFESDLKWAQKFTDGDWAETLKEWNSQPVFSGSAEPARMEGDFDRDLLVKALTAFSLAEMAVPAPALARLKKVCWVCGEKDKKFHELYVWLREMGVISRLQVLPKAGHRAIFDNPEGLAELLVREANL